MDKEDLLFNKLITTYKFSKEEEELLNKSYALAKRAHKGQKRKSDEDFICHTIETAIIIASIGMTTKTICAGILHDVLEDTDIPREEFESIVGKDILNLVEGVTKLKNIEYKGFNRHIKSLQKLFIKTASDPRVIIIKLCDRLHNMRTLFYLKEEDQERIAKETLYVLVPIAERLGIQIIKIELEDLCFKHLHNKEYKELEEKLKQLKEDGDIYLEYIRHDIKDRLKDKGLMSISSRIKGLYSYYKKLQRKESTNKIYDLFAVCVIVKDINNCYEALGVIHSLWHPLSSRIKDYIASPKPNGYQSLHTAVLLEGKIIEIQIKTKEMQNTATYGLASHYSYKYKNKDSLSKLNMPINKNFIDLENPSDRKANTEWLSNLGSLFFNVDKENIKDDIEDELNAHIFVYTPKIDAIELPVGATPIDFAYKVHTDLGNSIKEVYINGKIAQLKTRLKNGDTVNIIRSKGKTVTTKWLDVVKIRDTRRKIKSQLAKID